MLGKAQIKYIQSLSQKKYRHLHGQYLIEGEKITSEYIAMNYPLSNIYAVAEWIGDNERLLKKMKIPIVEINDRELKQISTLVTPNKVMAIAKLPKTPSLDETSGFFPETGFHLALETIQDPGNLGTIIRTADWFDVDSILCSPDCADAYNPKTVQSAMGSVARVKIHYAEKMEFMIEQMAKSKLPVYAAAIEGKNAFVENLPGNAILLLGNESKGLSEQFLNAAKHRIGIPRFGKAESLNVAVAAGILLSRFRSK